MNALRYVAVQDNSVEYGKVLVLKGHAAVHRAPGRPTEELDDFRATEFCRRGRLRFERLRRRSSVWFTRQQE